MKKNKIKMMERYMMGIGVFGFCPLLYAIIYYFSDVWAYVNRGDTKHIETWQVIFLKNKCDLLFNFAVPRKNAE